MTPWFEAAGEGPAVALLHAGIADSRMWRRQMETFADRHRVVGLDLRGFGRSPYPPGRFSHVDDVVGVLDRAGLDRAALVGCSFGGVVAVEVALSRPERVTALVLVASGVRGHPWGDEVGAMQEAEEEAVEAGDLERAVELNLRLWVDGPHRGPDDVDPGVRGLVAEMQRRAFELEREAPPGADVEMPAWDTIDRVGEIAVPTLVVVGDLDVAAVYAKADLLAERIPGSRKAVIEGAAHLPSLERPDEFDRVVLEFLAGLS